MSMAAESSASLLEQDASAHTHTHTSAAAASGLASLPGTTIAPRRRLAISIVAATAIVGVGVGLGVGLALLRSSPGFSAQSPVVINTWFPNANAAAYNMTLEGYAALDVVEFGCSVCEEAQCDGTVGWGGSPDSTGETTLDAVIMDGVTMDAGAVAYLRNVRNAISAARKVLHYTGHTVLAGDGATNFSASMGLPVSDLHSDASVRTFQAWQNASCQPNYWINVVGQNYSCPPYAPVPTPSPTPVVTLTHAQRRLAALTRTHTRAHTHTHTLGEGLSHAHARAVQPTPRAANPHISRYNHDTIGMCVLDASGVLAAGGSSNGANHKIAGRVGDVPIIGAAVYVDQTAGCAAATGDGDITMRFLPAYQAVEFMRQGYAPAQACEMAVRRIMRVYGTSFAIGLVCLNPSGTYAAASQGWTFTYAVAAPSTGGQTKVFAVPPLPA